MVNQDHAADFSFLKRINVKNKVLNLLTGGKFKAGFDPKRSARDAHNPGQPDNDLDPNQLLQDAGITPDVIHEEEG